MSEQKPIRFASLIRVSTEKQQKKGESLRTQKKQVEDAVGSLNGVVVREYAGQEHATAGYERKQLAALLTDAGNQLFDAVIVQEPLRWSRDNAKSKEGLETLRQNVIKFFCSTQEFDLFDPQAILFLGMSAEMGEFQARSQKLKSIQNRIERAKRLGAHTGGKPPFGRIWDSKTETWFVDAEKQTMILDVAKRYLAGESMAKLAEEYGVDHSSLHKTVTKRSGNKWTMSFKAKDLNVDESVEVTVPRLLPESIIQSVLEKTSANKTYNHGQLKHEYLLGRVIFCGHCGAALFGQANRGGRLYYRHLRKPKRTKCECRKTFIPAEFIEEHVIRRLFEMFGNVDYLVRAMKDAVPNLEELTEAREQEERLAHQIRDTRKSRDRLMGYVVKDKITEEQAEKQFDELNDREARLNDQLFQVTNLIEKSPSVSGIERTAKQVAGKTNSKRRKLSNWSEFYQGGRANARDYGKMTFDEKPALVHSFSAANVLTVREWVCT